MAINPDEDTELWADSSGTIVDRSIHLMRNIFASFLSVTPAFLKQRRSARSWHNTS
jgi:hypothetical protein